MGKILLVVIAFAAAVYAMFWLIERRRLRTLPTPVRRPRTPPRRAVAPDDDEDFLRELERRRRAGRDKKQGPPPEPPHASDT